MGERLGVGRDVQGLVLVALAGAVAGGLGALVIVYPLGFGLIDRLGPTAAREGIAALAIHVAAVGLAALSGALAVYWHFRTWHSPRQLAVATGLALLLSGGLATAPAIAVGWLTDFSTDWSVVAAEVAIVVAICACGLVAVGRVMGVQHSPPSSDSGPSPSHS